MVAVAGDWEMSMDGEFLPIQIAFSQYIRRWHESLIPTTPAVAEFAARPIEQAAMWIPGRLVDAVEEALASYERNENAGLPGKRSRFPVVLVGMSRDWMPITGDWGRQIGDRIEVALEEGGSVYGYRQAMFEVRCQIVIAAADASSARALASQFCLFVSAVENRRFQSSFQFGQYAVPMPVMIETPDIQFMDSKIDRKNAAVLYADLSLRATIPYFDAPKSGDLNDGSANTPPGYPVIQEVHNEIPDAQRSTHIDGAGISRDDL